MKYLEVRIKVSSHVDSSILRELGETLQLELPVDLEAQDVEVEDITYRVYDAIFTGEGE